MTTLRGTSSPAAKRHSFRQGFAFMTLTSLVAVGTATPALAAEKQVVIFEPKVEGGNIGDLEKQALDKALADAVKDMGYSPIPKDDLDAVLAGEKAGKCESAECQIRIARLLDAGYVLRYKVNVSADVVEQAAKHGKKEKEKEKPKGKGKDKEPEPQSPVQAAPVPSGPTANWKFTASLFNVTLAATAESAQNQPSECPNCSSAQAAQNIAERAKMLLIADKSHPRGTIEISTTPGEAQVFVDNVELTGKTPEGKPLSVKTFAGKHKLRVKKTDFQSQEQDVTVSDASPSVLNLTLKPGTDPEKVVYVATDTRRPKWRVALGVVGIAAGAALVGFGGVAFSVNGQPVLDNGQEDRTRIYNTKGLAAGLIAPGATLMMGGAVLIALPGEKKSDPNATPSPTQTLSLAPVGTGTGLLFRSSY